MEGNEQRNGDREYRRAERIVAEKVGFLRHLLVYVLVNVVILVVNFVTSSDLLWFVLVLGAWGVVLLAHFLIVFSFRGEWFERWRRREIEREVERQRRRG
jgi:hypothetical protein